MSNPQEDTEPTEVVKDTTAQVEEAEQDTDESEEVVAQADEGAEDEGEADVAAETPTRGMNRHQALSRELKTEREGRERLIGEKAAAIAEIELMKRQRYDTTAADNQRKEAEALALMEPAERAAYKNGQELHALKMQMYNMQVAAKGSEDRAIFRARAAVDPDIAKHADDVERMHADLQAKGVNSTRDDLLFWKLGKELFDNKAAAASKKGEAAKKRISAVSTSPASARGDSSASKKGRSLEERLTNVNI